MNKHDKRLIMFLFIVVMVIFIIFSFLEKKGRKIAKVYYENTVVLKIDLEKEGIHQYVVDGYNGEVILETQKGKIRVVEEDSPKHLCSLQGYISSTYQSIVCLPNKIVVKIEAQEELDSIVR